MKANLKPYIILHSSLFCFLHWPNWPDVWIQVNFACFGSLNMVLLMQDNSDAAPPAKTQLTKQRTTKPTTTRKKNQKQKTKNQPKTQTTSVALSITLSLSWWKRWDGDEQDASSAEGVTGKAFWAVPRHHAELSSVGQVCWERAGCLPFCWLPG